MNELATAARDYYDYGLSPVPLRDGTKHPSDLWKHHQKRRPTREQIEAWWSADTTTGVFVICGAVSRLIVVDCDSETAEEWFRDQLGDAFDETARVRSHKGHHYWFRLPDGVSARSWSRHADGMDFDVKAQGGGVAAPPSSHPDGGRYEWVRGLEHLQDAPTLLLELGEQRPSVSRNGPGGTTRSLTDLLNDLPKPGGRNVWLTSVAGHYAKQLGFFDGYLDTLLHLNSLLAVPLDDEEVRGVAHSVWDAEHPDGEEPTKPQRGGGGVATALVNLALERFELGQSQDGEAFAIAKDGPNLALGLRGDRGLRPVLARRFFERDRKAVSQNALAEAINTLEGYAREVPRQPVAIRIGRYEDDAIVYDLGDMSYRVVVLRPGGWEFADRSPVLFRRNGLTGAQPIPTRDGDLDALRTLLNVNDDSWAVLVAYLVAACIPDIPHPVLWLTGEQGTGKTVAMQMIAALVDPCPAQLRTAPRDQETWALVAAGSWVVPIDNVSGLTGWLSDCICRAVTGDGLVRRRLYTDSDYAVHNFRRVVMLNGIDVSALRGDLGDRLVRIELDLIPESRRRSEQALRADYDELKPALLGALFGLVTETLAVLPTVTLDAHPRMADFARVAAAVDEILGTDALATYLESRSLIHEEVVMSDPVAAAVVQFAHQHGTAWEGTATKLMSILEQPTTRSTYWPATPYKLSNAVRRAAEALRGVGVNVTFTRTAKTRLIRIEAKPSQRRLL